MNKPICNIQYFYLEISDERTLRDDLVIREGSSPEMRKGQLSLYEMNDFSIFN